MPVEILSATSRRDVSRWVDFPWHLYNSREHPQWIPPLRVTVHDALNRKKPFYHDADRELFLAMRNGRIVGRIAAIENKAHNRYYQDQIGFWGFFESIDDQEVANALLAAAGEWLKQRGMHIMRGPMMPSTNYDCGLLVEGFEHEPAFMTPWNPPYYATLLERAGHVKAKDLVAHFVPMAGTSFDLPSSFAATALRAQKSRKLTFRDLDFAKWHEELERCWVIYNHAWEDNWGFVPMTKEEFLVMANDLKPLIIPQFALMAEIAGEPAGFIFNVPDFNEILKTIPNGRLFPTGGIKLLLGKSKIRKARVMAFGIKREFRSRLIFPLLMYESFRRLRDHGMTGTEASWILEDNEVLLSALRSSGIKEYRRWRIYDAPLDTLQAARNP